MHMKLQNSMNAKLLLVIKILRSVRATTCTDTTTKGDSDLQVAVKGESIKRYVMSMLLASTLQSGPAFGVKHLLSAC